MGVSIHFINFVNKTLCTV